MSRAAPHRELHTDSHAKGVQRLFRPSPRNQAAYGSPVSTHHIMSPKRRWFSKSTKLSKSSSRRRSRRAKKKSSSVSPLNARPEWIDRNPVWDRYIPDVNHMVTPTATITTSRFGKKAPVSPSASQPFIFSSSISWGRFRHSRPPSPEAHFHRPASPVLNPDLASTITRSGTRSAPNTARRTARSPSSLMMDSPPGSPVSMVESPTSSPATPSSPAAVFLPGSPMSPSTPTSPASPGPSPSSTAFNKTRSSSASAASLMSTVRSRPRPSKIRIIRADTRPPSAAFKSHKRGQRGLPNSPTLLHDAPPFPVLRL